MSLLILACSIPCQVALAQGEYTRVQGGIIRGDTLVKNIALVFTADEFAEGGPFISKTLDSLHTKASFFLTGRHLRQHFVLAMQLHESGHYIGSHSHGHLLYCDWDKRDSLLVSKEVFESDLEQSYRELLPLGIDKSTAPFFLPPFEWYNDSISAWTAGLGLQLINFTPGTYSNADYTTPDMGKRYLPSDTIYNRIIRYEATKQNGLNGFILLLHLGTDPARTDKFYFLLPKLIAALQEKGYTFVRVDELLMLADPAKARID